MSLKGYTVLPDVIYDYGKGIALMEIGWTEVNERDAIFPNRIQLL